MLLAEFSIWPMDKGESVGPYVARALDIIDRSGLPYKLGPLGTCIEGEWPAVMNVIQQCYEELAKDSNRIACTVKMDWRKGQSGRLESMVYEFRSGCVSAGQYSRSGMGFRQRGDEILYCEGSEPQHAQL